MIKIPALNAQMVVIFVMKMSVLLALEVIEMILAAVCKDISNKKINLIVNNAKKFAKIVLQLVIVSHASMDTIIKNSSVINVTHIAKLAKKKQNVYNAYLKLEEAKLVLSVLVWKDILKFKKRKIAKPVNPLVILALAPQKIV